MGAGEGVSSCLWEWMVRCVCETQRAAFVGRFLAWSNDAGSWSLDVDVLGGARRRSCRCRREEEKQYSQVVVQPTSGSSEENTPEREYFTAIESIKQAGRKI